jgi:DNA-binding NtrC family response regulator
MTETPRKVLIIDDEVSIRFTLKTVLEGSGLVTDAVATGEAGVERLLAEQFDLALVDKNLPGIDGLEVIRQVREKRPELAMVLMTSYGTVESSLRAMDLGAAGYLLKPFDDVFEVGRQVSKILEDRDRRRRREAKSGTGLERVTEGLRTLRESLEAREAHHQMASVAVLLRDDAEREVVSQALNAQAMAVDRIKTLAQLIARLSQTPAPQAVVFDYRDAAEVTELVGAIGQKSPDTAAVAVGKAPSLDLTRELIKVGSAAFIERPIDPARLVATVRRLVSLRPSLDRPRE